MPVAGSIAPMASAPAFEESAAGTAALFGLDQCSSPVPLTPNSRMSPAVPDPALARWTPR